MELREYKTTLTKHPVLRLCLAIFTGVIPLAGTLIPVFYMYLCLILIEKGILFWGWGLNWALANMVVRCTGITYMVITQIISLFLLVCTDYWE